MAWTEKDIPDLSGRTAVVTGANGGLGFQTALALAGAGAHVVVAARDPEKTAAATARIRERYPAASLDQDEDRRLVLRQRATARRSRQPAAPSRTPLFATAAGWPLCPATT